MTTTPLSRRLLALAVAIVATLGLVATACGDDSTDEASSKTTTTAKGSGSDGGDTTTTAASDGSSTTVEKLSFDEGIKTLRSKIDEADGDLCNLIGIFDEDINIEDPSSTEQTKEAVDVLAELFTAIGEAAGSEGEDLTTAAQKLKDEAEKAGYTTESLQGDKLYTDSGLDKAITGVLTSAQSKCGTPGGSETTVGP
jgi:hypothetical protein